MKKLISLVILALLVFAQCGMARTSNPLPWVGTWAAAAEYAAGNDLPKTSLAGNSLQQVVQVSLGGKSLELQLSNEFSRQPLEIKAVYINNVGDSKSTCRLTFNKKKSVVIAPGDAVYSDECSYDLQPLQRLLITICYGSQVPENITSHRGSRTTSYIYKGEIKPGVSAQPIEQLDHWYNISKINVRSDAKAVAILGNSITDGRGSITNEQNRWPDFMARALNGTVGVLNLGIGGNCVVEGGISEPAMKRFSRDILGQKGVTTVVIFEGVNDIGTSGGRYEHVADTLCKAYQQLAAMAHDKGCRVVGATITPFKGNGWYSYFHEAVRQTVNEWIRSAQCFDWVIDFDQLVADPADTQRLKADYSDDWLHLNPEGYERMGRHAAEQYKNKN